MVRRSSHDRQSGSNVHAFIRYYGLEWGKSLIVVHGKHSVESVVCSMTEKAVSREWSKNAHAIVGQFFYCRFYNGFFFRPDDTLVASMRIKRKNGYAWSRDIEVSFQRLVVTSATRSCSPARIIRACLSSPSRSWMYSV